MRWAFLLALVGACTGSHAPTATGASIVLDVPNGALDPKGYTTAEIVLHEPDGDLVRSASVVGAAFELGALDPSASVSIEATLRNESGAAVGYGRTATPTTLGDRAQIVIPVRRPIVYIAGTVSRDVSTGSVPDLRWSEVPATIADLSLGGPSDGRAQLGGAIVHMVSAGPSLFAITQATRNPDGLLTGPARVAPVAMTDHQVGAMLAGSVAGAVRDTAGTDDGATLVLGTSTQLYAMATATGEVRVLADGNFARVAVLMTDSGELHAIAIKNRGLTTGTCATTAEIWWAPLAEGEPARLIATGGFSDVAADRGHAYYVDACKGELGEVTAMGPRALRTLAQSGGARPTAVAVSNGQAYVGVETPPSTTALVVVSLRGAESEPRTLWSEAAQQVIKASNLVGVQRQLDASSAVFGHLEIGAGGDYVALSTSAHFRGNRVGAANFPEVTIDAEELRVFDAATGGILQRYRSWCDGSFTVTSIADIDSWECALTPGQSEAATAALEHHIQSLTFLFGKR